MTLCMKDQIQNLNPVIGYTAGDFETPVFFPDRLRDMYRKQPHNSLLTGMSGLIGIAGEEAMIRELPY